MNAKDEFFRLTVIAAKLHSETAAKRAVDPISLHGYGFSQDAIARFIAAMKPLARTPEFERYLAGILLEAYQYLFAMVDGICAFAADSPHHFNIVDNDGRPLGEDLHMDFERFLQEEGHVVTDPPSPDTKRGI